MPHKTRCEGGTTITQRKIQDNPNYWRFFIKRQAGLKYTSVSLLYTSKEIGWNLAPVLTPLLSPVDNVFVLFYLYHPALQRELAFMKAILQLCASLSRHNEVGYVLRVYVNTNINKHNVSSIRVYVSI